MLNNLLIILYVVFLLTLHNKRKELFGILILLSIVILYSKGSNIKESNENDIKNRYIKTWVDELEIAIKENNSNEISRILQIIKDKTYSMNLINKNEEAENINSIINEIMRKSNLSDYNLDKIQASNTFVENNYNIYS